MGSIVHLEDSANGAIVSYKEITKYYDGTDMSLNKCDGSYYRYKSGKYYQKIVVENGVSFVRDFGALGNGLTDDSRALQLAINVAGEGGRVVFDAGCVYLISSQLNVKKNQIFEGNKATLKRANQIIYTLASQATQASTSLSLNSVSGLKVGDEIHIYIGSKGTETTNPRKIKSINGNTVTLETSIGSLVNGSNTQTYAIGVKVGKSYTMLAGKQYPTPEPVTISNLNFDGNSDNNTASNYWYINTCLAVYGKGTIIDGCSFVDISNECIVTHGATVTNNYGKGLNGSFVHLSSPREALGQNIQGCRITNNIVIGSNRIDPDFTLHSRACIENSWNAGTTVISNNVFEGSGFGFPYDFTMESTSPDADMDNVLISNNIFKNYAHISPDLGYWQTWPLSNRNIVNNVYENCGSTNMQRLHEKEIVFKDNVLNGTELLNYLHREKEQITFDKPPAIYGTEVSEMNFQTDNHTLKFQLQPGLFIIRDMITNKVLFTLDLNAQVQVLPADTQSGVARIVRSVTDGNVNVTKEYLNTTYPVTDFPLGTEVVCGNGANPILYKRYDETNWLILNSFL